MIAGKSLDLLEFPKVLSVVSDLSHSDASRNAILKIHPLGSKSDLERKFGLIREMLQLFHDGIPVKLSPFSDITPLIRKLAPEGAVLEPLELLGFVPVLRTALDISRELHGKKGIPLLSELTSPLTGNADVLNLIEGSLDSEGHIRDEASFRLSELRGEIRRREARIRKRLDEMVHDSRTSVFLQDDFITKRSGRWVIPVRMDSKGQIPGVVHDISRSGETAYVEPLSLIPHSNELENLLAEQKAEELRILRNISSRIRGVTHELEAQFAVLVQIDVFNAISLFAERYKMEIPLLHETASIRLAGARHPLLAIALEKAGPERHVVPLDVELGGDENVMVITGSNAGGKTIALKAIGLLVIMALSGMPIPASASSRIPLIRDLLIDIGDEQSIERNLSTFSAHIEHVSEIVENAGPYSLVLIDELGTGTDPDEGGALACAVLEQIQKSGSLAFSTTHLTGIKGFVHRTVGMVNASMEFDERTNTPLYTLKVGEPGRSHALEIAGKFGLPASIVERARNIMGRVNVELDEMISDLNDTRREYEERLKLLDQERAALEEQRRLWEKKMAETESGKREILAEAHRDAAEILRLTKRQMHDLLEEVKKKDKSGVRKGLRQIEQSQTIMESKIREYEPAGNWAPSIETVHAGDTVFIKTLGVDATVIEIQPKHDRVRVRAGSADIEVPFSDIAERKGEHGSVQKGYSLPDASVEFSVSRINLIGLRVEEAMSKLEPFLNHASLAGLKEVTIIHGIGKGILARAVREHLTGHPLVISFRTGERSEGGAGVTITTLA
ncbi:MAG: endonuclease MutS2 [bacterium]